MFLQGIVTRQDGPRIWVDLGEREVPCVLRGKSKKKHLRVTSLVVIGDRVEVELLKDGTGVISSVSDRTSELVRPGFHGYAHVIAANVDLLLIVQAARQPNFKLHLVDRFIATASRAGIEPVVVVNKCDLEQESVIRSWVAPLHVTGTRVLLTSAADGRGVEELRQALLGRVSVLAGQSGVGKSSLVNALDPEWAARTASVAAWSGTGRHTTTSSRLYPLPGGGYLADTPGIKELGLFEDAGQAVEDAFPDIAAAGEGCRFRDCTHSHEPGCSVKAAVARGEIREERYRSYLRLRS